MNYFIIVRELLSRSEPGELTPKGVWDKKLQASIQALAPSSPAEQSVKSALLLWNDDLDGCHSIAQELPDEYGAYLHGIMHRREPDYGNAKYWFRRVGDHPLFPQLLAAASEIDASMLQDAKTWDPIRMVDWCEEGAKADFLRVVQALEIQGLCFYWLDQAKIPRS